MLKALNATLNMTHPHSLSSLDCEFFPHTAHTVTSAIFQNYSRL